MANIETNLKRRRMPTGTSAVLQPTDSPELAARTQAFGKGADITSGFAMTFALRERDNQLTNFEGVATEGYNKFLSERARDPDASSYLTKYSEFIKSIPTDSFRSPETKRIAQNWLKKQGGVWGKQVLGMANQQSKRNTLDAIALAEFQSIKLRNPDIINRAITRGVKNGVITEDAGILTMEQTHRGIMLGLIEDEAQEIFITEGYEESVKWVMDNDIELDEKNAIASKIKRLAANKQLEYESYVEKTEQDFVGKYDKEQLGNDEIIASNLSATKKLMWKRLVDAQAEERLSGEVELNWETYDRLQSMVEDYDAGNIEKEVVQDAISKEAGKTIPTTIARSLRDRLATKDKPDDPMNRSDVKRGLGVLTDLESFEVEQAKKDEEDFEVIREIRLAYQKKMDEFERWIRGQEKLTDKDVQSKIKEMTELEVEETAKGVLDYIGGFYKEYYKYIFGVKAYEEISKRLRGEPKEGEEDLTGMTDEELEAIIRGK